MKKILTLLIIIVAISCKKDQSEEENKVLYQESQLLGRWVYESLKINGISAPYMNKCRVREDSFFLIIRPDQDHLYHELKFGFDCLPIHRATTWQLQGNNLILHYLLVNRDAVYKILRLTDTNLDLSITLDYDLDGKSDNLEIYLVKGFCDPNDSLCNQL
jgi:hypothetical protein